MPLKERPGCGIGTPVRYSSAIGLMRSAGIMLPGNGSRMKPVPLGFARVVSGS